MTEEFPALKTGKNPPSILYENTVGKFLGRGKWREVFWEDISKVGHGKSRERRVLD